MRVFNGSNDSDEIGIGGTLRFHDCIGQGVHLLGIEALVLSQSLQAEDAVMNRFIELKQCFKCVEAQASFLSSVAVRIRRIVIALLPVAVAISRSDMPSDSSSIRASGSFR